MANFLKRRGSSMTRTLRVGDRLFVKAKSSAKFDVWDQENQVLFHRGSPLGKNKVIYEE